MRLTGKVTIVTGASVGLGRAVAARFAREGASVVAADVNEADGSALVAQLQSNGLDAMFVPTDVSQECAVKALFDATCSRYGRVDVLHSNAAVLLPDRDLPIHEISLDTWDYVMSVNLRGAFLCAKYAVSSMLQNGGGSVIFLGSPTGLVGCAPALTAYSTSKAAIMGLHARHGRRPRSRQHSRELDCSRHHGHTHERLYPGRPGGPGKVPRSSPVGRLGTPADIEGIALFLASDESSYCTGGLYMCDGGLTAV